MGDKLKLIVRVTKNRYMHNDRLVSSTTATLLKRKSVGGLSDLIQDAEYDLSDLDLDKYEEGVYQLTTENHSFDIETGYLDSYTLTLIPLKERHNENR